MAGVPSIKLSPTQKAYLAGLVDGEGYIGIVRTRKQPTSTNPDPLHLNAYMSIGMTDGDYLVNLAGEIGVGNTYRQKRQREHWKIRTDWRLCGNACRALLPQIVKYLRLKKPQAKLLLRYLELSAHKPCKNPPRNREYKKKVLALYDQMKALNRKGC